MKGKLSPSLMCADVLNLQSELEALDNLGVDFIHLDFMDNKFVPNITLDTNLIKSVKSVLKNMRRDIHIMAYEPVQYFDRMDIGEGDIVAVHYEACPDLADSSYSFRIFWKRLLSKYSLSSVMLYLL